MLSFRRIIRIWFQISFWIALKGLNNNGFVLSVVVDLLDASWIPRNGAVFSLNVPKIPDNSERQSDLKCSFFKTHANASLQSLRFFHTMARFRSLKLFTGKEGSSSSKTFIWLHWRERKIPNCHYSVCSFEASLSSEKFPLHIQMNLFKDSQYIKKFARILSASILSHPTFYECLSIRTRQK